MPCFRKVASRKTLVHTTSHLTFMTSLDPRGQTVMVAQRCMTAFREVGLNLGSLTARPTFLPLRLKKRTLSSLGHLL